MDNIVQLKAEQEHKEPRVHFHWQNLNDKRDGTQGSGFWHGRCWLRFQSKWCDGRTITFSWNFWTHFCGVGCDVDEDRLTLGFAFPPIAFWLTIGMHFWPLTKWPRRPLSATYPDTMVIDERECSVRIHGGKLWIHPWSKSREWVKSDPWWVRGVMLNLNPFEWTHMVSEVRCADGSWMPHVGSRESDKEPDNREVFTYPYTYTLKRGEVQNRTATVHVERMSWRPKCLRWTRLLEKSRTSIEVSFSDEVGERSGSWKGGCIGCGYEIKPGETPLETLSRMERERKF